MCCFEQFPLDCQQSVRINNQDETEQAGFSLLPTIRWIVTLNIKGFLYLILCILSFILMSPLLQCVDRRYLWSGNGADKL